MRKKLYLYSTSDASHSRPAFVYFRKKVVTLQLNRRITMTKQPFQDHNALMAAMKALDEPMPSVGIFFGMTIKSMFFQYYY